MPEAFHFQQPGWFLALVPLAALIWRLRGHASSESAWRRVCDPGLLSYLLIAPPGADRRLPLGLLVASWLIAVIALADPVWEKRPQPVFSSEEARVVVLDLSRSMNDADLAPSRLERARYKVEDVLRRSREGQVGLVAFAGDAFVVSPLTSDARTITEMLQALEPGLMPVQGSRADRGLRKAGELLAQGGAPHGEILLVTDGYEGRDAPAAARELHEKGYTVSVLGVGTADGAPLADGSGGFVRDAGGAIVVPRLDEAALRALAAAGGGRYSTITGNDADLDALLRPLAPRLETRLKQTGLETDAWQSRGPWLAVLLLPLAALAFRRGWLLGVVLLVAAGTAPPRPAMASTWDDLWTRRDQQAAQALAAGDQARAAALATDPGRRGTAQYRAGDYGAALAEFSQTKGPDADYNQGNALARLGRYKEAIAAYDKALAAQPGMEDAQHNKAVIEELLRQQEKQQKQQNQQENQQARQDQKQQGQQQAPPSARDSSGGKGKEDKSAASSGRQGSQPQDKQGEQNAAAGQASSKDAKSQSGSSSGNAGKEQEKSQGRDKSGTNKEQAAQQEEAPQHANAAAGSGHSPQGDNPEHPQDRAASDTSTAASRAGAGEPPEASQAQAQQAAGRPADDAAEAPATPPGTQAANEAPPSEEQQATEQWLRRIPDDPGGLLRRKFLYQYRQRAAGDEGSGQGW
jgi:Ca-activated chloride channel family protein